MQYLGNGRLRSAEHGAWGPRISGLVVGGSTGKTPDHGGLGKSQAGDSKQRPPGHLGRRQGSKGSANASISDRAGGRRAVW